MADTSISNLTATSPATAAHRIPIAITPFGAGNNGYITPALILSYGTSPITGTTITATTQLVGAKVSESVTAGAGWTITAGTAASAVSALNITQTIGINAGNATLATASPFGIQWTWNDVNAATGVKWVVTDTNSAATALPFQILGGAGTRNLYSLDKLGNISLGGTTNPVGITASASDLTLTGATNLHFRIGGTAVSFMASGNSGGIVHSGIYAFGFANGALTNGTTHVPDVTISRNATGILNIGTGNGTGFGGRIKLTSTIIAATTVANLNASPTIGEISVVNDALAVTVKGATLAAGGSAVSVVVWNGSNWVGI